MVSYRYFCENIVIECRDTLFIGKAMNTVYYNLYFGCRRIEHKHRMKVGQCCYHLFVYNKLTFVRRFTRVVPGSKVPYVLILF